MTDKLISSILKHDSKVTSYKIALLRAINDVVLAFPDMRHQRNDVAVPLRMLAEFWIAYYWPFVSSGAPIYQGPRAWRNGVLRNDISFRPALENLRLGWEDALKSQSQPADGFYLIGEYKVARRRALYPPTLITAYETAITQIKDALLQPICHAGPEQWTVFDRPRRLRDLGAHVTPVPGAQPSDVCLVIKAELWQSFHNLSLWIEALSIHQWCLFTERIAQETIDQTSNQETTNQETNINETTNEESHTAQTTNARQRKTKMIDRGTVYLLLTARPDNRRPLTWERNQIDLLMMEGAVFTCPWTGRVLRQPGAYDLDHLLPLAIYPINEMWNLVPADSAFNQHTKRDRLPTQARLAVAEPRLVEAYKTYGTSGSLNAAMQEDAKVRFAAIKTGPLFAVELAKSTINFMDEVATARSVSRF